MNNQTNKQDSILYKGAWLIFFIVLFSGYWWLPKLLELAHTPMKWVVPIILLAIIAVLIVFKRRPR